jgi:hypothetical protein
VPAPDWPQSSINGRRWIAGFALEDLVALGEAALRFGTIAEAIDVSRHADNLALVRVLEASIET